MTQLKSPVPEEAREKMLSHLLMEALISALGQGHAISTGDLFIARGDTKIEGEIPVHGFYILDTKRPSDPPILFAEPTDKGLREIVFALMQTNPDRGQLLLHASYAPDSPAVRWRFLLNKCPLGRLIQGHSLEPWIRFQEWQIAEAMSPEPNEDASAGERPPGDAE